MSFSFDPDLIEMPIGHHIGGAFVAAQGEVPIHRPSDNVAFADCPVADVDVGMMVDEAVAELSICSAKVSSWTLNRSTNELESSVLMAAPSVS